MDDIIFNRIKKCVEAALECQVEQFYANMSLTDDLDMESLQIVTLQIELEDEFNISFDPLEDDFFEIFRTIGSIYSTVKRKML